MCKRLAGKGTKVSFIGKLGDDDNGRAYRENFKQCGIETEFVGMAPTGVPRLVGYQMHVQHYLNQDNFIRIKATWNILMITIIFLAVWHRYGLTAIEEKT